MTDDELRAAAERLTANYWDTYHKPNSADPLGEIADPILNDGRKIARTWLSDHPVDDGEPVTGDWLVSIGGVFADLSWRRQPESLGFGEPSNGYIFAGSLGFRAGAGWHAYHLDADGFSGSESYLCPVPNRGRARQLMSALGIPTTEEPKS